MDIQGFKILDNKFIVKECSICIGNSIQTFIFLPPCPFQSLNEKDKNQVQWIERNRKYSWSEGFIKYDKLIDTIKPYAINKCIIVKGEEKIKWFKDLFCFDNCINIEKFNCPKLLNLILEFEKNGNLFECVSHKNSLFCALKNVLAVRRWIQENKNVINTELCKDFL